MNWEDKFIGTSFGAFVGGVVTMAVTGAAAVSAPVISGAVGAGGVTYGAIKMGEALFNLSKKGYDAITMNKGAVTAFQNDMKNSQPFIDVDFDAQLLEEIQQAVADMGDKAILMINTKTREAGLIDKSELKRMKTDGYSVLEVHWDNKNQQLHIMSHAEGKVNGITSSKANIKTLTEIYDFKNGKANIEPIKMKEIQPEYSNHAFRNG